MFVLQGRVTCVWLVRENGDDVEPGGLTIGMAEQRLRWQLRILMMLQRTVGDASAMSVVLLFYVFPLHFKEVRMVRYYINNLRSANNSFYLEYVFQRIIFFPLL